jgi:hypothetical protein
MDNPLLQFYGRRRDQHTSNLLIIKLELTEPAVSTDNVVGVRRANEMVCIATGYLPMKP